jgi:1-phosphofructokinase
MTRRAFTLSLNPAIDRTLWVDTLHPGEPHLATAEHIQAGGKGFNVAAGLASLGVDVTVCGWLGQANAARYEADLAARGIRDRMARVPGAIRENLQLTDTRRGETTSVDLPGISYDAVSLAAAQAELHAVLAQEVRPGDWCLLTGSLPPGVDAGAWAGLARLLGRAGARLVFDMGGEVLSEVLRQVGAEPGACPIFVKPNRTELEALAGRPLPTRDDLLAAARDLQRQGAAQVLVSLGAEGALVLSTEGACHLTVPQVPVCTTVGAGDAVVAGTTAALMEGMPFADAARFGLGCAAWRIQRRSADLPDRAALDGLVARVGSPLWIPHR